MKKLLLNLEQFKIIIAKTLFLNFLVFHSNIIK